MADRRTFSRLKQLTAQTGLARSTIYDLIRKGRFPRQIHLGPRTAVWDDAEIAAWLDAKIAESRKDVA